MTCAHVVVGDNFTCNINGRKYKVTGNSSILDCNSKNLILCKKCGVQYVGKTSQILCCRVNNHRARVKQLFNLQVEKSFL